MQPRLSPNLQYSRILQGRAWWRTPLIPALWRQRQADFWVQGQPGVQSEVQDSQGYTEKPCLEKKQKNKTKKKKQNQKNKKKKKKEMNSSRSWAKSACLGSWGGAGGNVWMHICHLWTTGHQENLLGLSRGACLPESCNWVSIFVRATDPQDSERSSDSGDV